MMNAQPRFRRVQVGLCIAVAFGTWLAATWLLAFGLWIFVIGDRESKLFLLAPLLSIVLARGAAMGYMRSSAVGPWRAFALFVAGIMAALVVGWYLIMVVDEIL